MKSLLSRTTLPKYFKYPFAFPLPWPVTVELSYCVRAMWVIRRDYMPSSCSNLNFPIPDIFVIILWLLILILLPNSFKPQQNNYLIPGTTALRADNMQRCTTGSPNNHMVPGSLSGYWQHIEPYSTTKTFTQHNISGHLHTIWSCSDKLLPMASSGHRTLISTATTGAFDAVQNKCIGIHCTTIFARNRWCTKLKIEILAEYSMDRR